MNDQSVTHTVLSSDTSDPTAWPMVTGMVDCHSHDHAEQEFETLYPYHVILGIYSGDLSLSAAMELCKTRNRA